MKGYTAREIIGRHVSVFYPPDRVAAGYPQKELDQAAEAGFSVDEGWRVRKNGTRYWAHVVVTAQRDANGALTGFIKVIRNDSDVGGLTL